MAKESSGNKLSIIVILVIILLIALAVIGWKYHQAKEKWAGYAMQMQHVSMQRPINDSHEAAMVIGATIATTPSESNPLYKQSKQLESYVTTMSQELNRDVVIVDKNKVVLADTIVANVGKKYQEDKHNEVNATIGDGATRTFLEKSIDYPSGIDQTVVPFKDINSTIIGAVILSSTPIK